MPPANGWPRPLLFGLNNETTRIVLRGLLARGIVPAGLVLAETDAPHLIGPRDGAYRLTLPPAEGLSLLSPAASDHIVHQAWAAGLPVVVVRDLAHISVAHKLAELGVAVGVVACFSRRIPTAVLDQFRHGVMNIHPSLLPAYRGPAPLFWQFRENTEAFGVTVHLVDAGLDTGDILAQRIVALPKGISGPGAVRRLTEEGVALIAGQLGCLAQAGALASNPQVGGGSYQRWPADSDFEIPADWTARHAYNFMRGTAEWGRPYRIDLKGRTLVLAEALAVSDDEAQRPIVYRPNGDVWVRLAEGTLWARPAPTGLMTLKEGH